MKWATKGMRGQAAARSRQRRSRDARSTGTRRGATAPPTTPHRVRTLAVRTDRRNMLRDGDPAARPRREPSTSPRFAPRARVHRDATARGIALGPWDRSILLARRSAPGTSRPLSNCTAWSAPTTTSPSTAACDRDRCVGGAQVALDRDANRRHGKQRGRGTLDRAPATWRSPGSGGDSRGRLRTHGRHAAPSTVVLAPWFWEGDPTWSPPLSTEPDTPAFGIPLLQQQNEVGCPSIWWERLFERWLVVGIGKALLLFLREARERSTGVDVLSSGLSNQTRGDSPSRRG